MEHYEDGFFPEGHAYDYEGYFQGEQEFYEEVYFEDDQDSDRHSFFAAPSTPSFVTSWKTAAKVFMIHCL